MGKFVICVDELRLIDSYTIRHDYFMGLSSRLNVYLNCTDREKRYIFQHDLMEYLEVGRQIRLVPDRVFEKIFKLVFDNEV